MEATCWPLVDCRRASASALMDDVSQVTYLFWRLERWRGRGESGVRGEVERSTIWPEGTRNLLGGRSTGVFIDLQRSWLWPISVRTSYTVWSTSAMVMAMANICVDVFLRTNDESLAGRSQHGGVHRSATVMAMANIRADILHGFAPMTSLANAIICMDVFALITCL